MLMWSNVEITDRSYQKHAWKVSSSFDGHVIVYEKLAGFCTKPFFGGY